MYDPFAWTASATFFTEESYQKRISDGNESCQQEYLTFFHAATCSSDQMPGTLKVPPQVLCAMKVASPMINVPGILARAA
jgi:hypothetical protein